MSKNKEHFFDLSTSGERLRYIRSLTMKSRREVAEISKISEETIRSWETGRNRIKKSAIEKCINFYRELGIYCTKDWIETGIGKAPKLFKEMQGEDEINSDVIALLNKSSPYLISYVNRDEEFVFINEQYKEIFDLLPGEVPGKKMKELIGNQGYEKCKPYMDRALAGEEVTFEYPWKFGEDQYKHLRINYIPHHNQKGEVIGFFSFIIETGQQTAQYNLAPEDNLSDMLPNVGELNVKYDNKLYKKCCDIGHRLLCKYKVECNFAQAIQIINNIYLYSLEKEKPDISYAESIVNILIKSHRLSCASS